MDNNDMQIICYLDIMGFKGLVKNNINHHNIIEEIFKFIDKTFTDLRLESEGWGMEAG